MIALALCIALFVVQPAGMNPTVVQAPDSPVRLDRAKILNIVADEPPVLLYSATNLTDQELEQFTVLVFIFDAQGQLKARQVAPGRRTWRRAAQSTPPWSLMDRRSGRPIKSSSV